MPAQWPRPGIVFRHDPREPLPPELAHLACNPVMLGNPAPRVRQFGRGLPTNAVDARVQPHPHPRDGPPPGAGPDEHDEEIVLLPPSATSVDIKIVEDTATATVTNIFENTTSARLRKAQYQFPLPHECSIVGFRCRIGAHTLLEGTIKPKPEARRTFDVAVEQAGAAGLVEQCTPEIFKTRIGNIPSGARVEVELSFIMLLGQAFPPAENVSSTILSIPTYIAPRYGPAPVEILEVGRRGFDKKLSVQVEILAADEITDVTSDSHDISVERGVGRRLCQRWAEFMAAPSRDDPRAAMVRLADGSTCLDKDLVVCFKARTPPRDDAVLACLEIHPTLDKHMALMITIPPKFMLRDLSANDHGEIVFLADRSGSMSDKLVGLKSAMEMFLRGMHPSRSFNIWCFGSRHTSLWPHSRPYSQETMDGALNYVADSFHSDMGGTELLPALQAIVAARERHLAVDVIVLTDGEVWRQDETISFVGASRRESEGRLRFFALGIGDAVSHDLVEGIAKAGGGYAEIIPPGRQDGWHSRMVAVLTAAQTSHCGPIDVELGDTAIRVGQGAGGGAPKVHRSPLDVSTLSPFIRNRIFYLFEGNPEEPPRSVCLKTRGVGGETICTTVQVRRLQNRDLKIHRFAARSLLGDLQRNQSWIHRRQDNARADDRNDLIRREGERLGCKFSLVSKWTSIVAVRAEADAIQARMPVLVPGDVGEDELGLLRPRGGAGGRPQLALQGPGALPAGEDQGEDRETETESESESDQDSDRAADDQLRFGGDGNGRNDDNDGDAPAGGGVFPPGSPGPGDRGSGPGGGRGLYGGRGAGSGCGAGVAESRRGMETSRRRRAYGSGCNAGPGPPTWPSVLADSARLSGSVDPARPSGLVDPAQPSASASWALSSWLVDPEPSMFMYSPRPSGLDSAAAALIASSSSILEPYNPTFIPPSSTALVQRQCETEPTESSRRAEKFVLRIVAFQQADGSFRFTNDFEMRKNMGMKVFRMLADFADIRPVVAATALLAALLEALFPSFRSLWLLAVSKANDFVRSSAIPASGERAAGAPWLFAPVDDAIQASERAKALMADLTMYDLNIDENGEPQPDQNEPVELLVAPVETQS